MNQIYFKNLLYALLCCCIFLFFSENSFAQRSTSKKADRQDLVANIHKVQLDQKRIASLKRLITDSKESGNRKSLKVHKEKLALEEKVLKADWDHAKEQQALYEKNKTKRIQTLESDLVAARDHYESIRKQIKKDLAKKNDFAIRKDADDLLKAVQVKNETATELSMEKSDLIATREAVDAAWKKVKQDSKDPATNFIAPEADTNLSTK